MSQAILWVTQEQFEWISHAIFKDHTVPAYALGVIQTVEALALEWTERDTGKLYYVRSLPPETPEEDLKLWFANRNNPFIQFIAWRCIGLVLDIRDAQRMHEFPGTITDFRLRKLDRAEIRELARVAGQGPRGLSS